MHTELTPTCWAWAGWETDRDYRRKGGRDNVFYFGNGQWMNKWRERVTSEQLLEELENSGITHLVTYFYKGFGIKTEQVEWPRQKEFIKKAHKHGLKVIGYLQAGSIFPETFLEERPEAYDWMAKQYDDSPQFWASSYYRVMPCLTSQPYLNYLQDVIKIGLEELKFDGVHFDNSYYRGCWCDRCKMKFQEWLVDNYDLDSRMGIPNATHVQPPPLPSEQTVFFDPLQQLWMEFNVQIRLKALKKFYDTAHNIYSDVLVVSNPAFPRRPAFKAKLSIDPARESEVCDILFAENGNLPRIDDEGIVSQVEAYLYAEAAEYNVYSTSWQKGAVYAKSPAETPAQLWTQISEEFSYHSAVLGNNWALRSASNNNKLLMDKFSELWDTFVQIMDFYKQVCNNENIDKRSQWSEVALFINTDTLTLSSKDLPALQALLQTTLRLRMPIKFVFSNQPIPSNTRVLIAWQQACLSDVHLDKLKNFALRPNSQVIIAGNTGRFDEFHVPRNEEDWKVWRKSKGFITDLGEPIDIKVSENEKQFGTDYLGFNNKLQKNFTNLINKTDWQQPVQIDAPEGVFVNTEKTDDGKVLVHLRDQRGRGEIIKNVQIKVSTDVIISKKVKLLYPDKPEGLVSNPIRKSNSNLISLPNFKFYGLIVL